jgi:hypothetical protein
VLRLDSSLLQLASFADWLPEHAGLIRSLSITTSRSPSDTTAVEGLQAEVHYRAAHKLLQQAMQLATAAPVAAVVPNDQTPSQHQQGLQLVSFSSTCLAQPGALGVLAALPAHSITQLSLDVCGKAVDAAAFSAALTRLHALQQLHLVRQMTFTVSTLPTIGNCLGGISQLTQLTSLWLEGDWAGSDQDLQQLLSTPLPLRRLHLKPHRSLPVLELSNLQQLERLDLMCTRCRVGSVLPLQLKQLYLEARNSAEVLAAVLPLQQLQRLSLDVGFPEHQPLLQLAQMPSLQHISLEYCLVEEAVGGSAAWRHLPSQELSVTYDDFVPSCDQLAAILCAVAECTQLTKLKIEACAGLANDDETTDHLPVAACGKLAGLTGLKSLCIVGDSNLVPGDVLYLTALTGLTRLELAWLGPAVDDVAATALACSLKQLQHLDLARCELGSMVCAAAIGHLSQLTALNLIGMSKVTQDRLMLLTRLSRLQLLGVGLTNDDTVPDDVLQEFWAAVAAAAPLHHLGDPPRRWSTGAKENMQEYVFLPQW